MEGLGVGGRRTLHAEVGRELGEKSRDLTAEEVLGNIDAMTWAVNNIGATQKIDLDHIREIHRRLVFGTRLEPHGGVIRDRQNWIRGGDYSPCEAQFVPPPPQDVERLLDDLCNFCNGDDLPRDYIARLMGPRYEGDPKGLVAHEALNRWIALFASAASRAVRDARMFEQRVGDLQTDWRQRVGHVRRGSTVDLLIDSLPGAPVITVNSAARMTSRSFKAVNLAVRELLAAGVLRQIHVGRRNRAFEAMELIDTFNTLERQLASPQANTRTSPPARPVPARRPN